MNDEKNNFLAINVITLDRIFQLNDCSNCLALYVFYCKTTLWQKTNIIKANDLYVKKSLKWGIDKITRTKKTLKENGFIETVQRRENGKVKGWYIKVNYLVSEKCIKELETKILNDDLNHNTQNQELEKPTTGYQETNALKEINKCLKTDKKKTYGEFKHVRLSDSDIEKLNELTNDLNSWIIKLDEYIELKGTKYKNHYLVLRRWISKDKEKHQKPYEYDL